MNGLSSGEKHLLSLLTGCIIVGQDIIDGIDSICHCTENKREIEKNVLGIIDRDTREYRKTLPKNDDSLSYFSLNFHRSVDILYK